MLKEQSPRATFWGVVLGVAFWAVLAAIVYLIALG